MSKTILCPDRRSFVSLAASAAAVIGYNCASAFAKEASGRRNDIAGNSKSAKSHMLELGADLLQDDSPISAINMYLNGFHFYADLSRFDYMDPANIRMSQTQPWLLNVLSSIGLLTQCMDSPTPAL